MKVNVREDGQIMVIELNGHVDASNAFQLEEKMEEIVSSGKHKIVVNFKTVDYISSAGLRVLLTAIKKVKSHQGDMVLCEMSDNIHKIFSLAGFTNIFTIMNNEMESMTFLGKN